MKKRFLFLFLISALVLVNSCQKETSFENGNGPSEGSLQDDGAGDCLPKTVAGAYVVGTLLVGTTNYIEVQVDVTKTGSYIIYTDTVNGIYFRASGVFATTGLVTLQLKGNGTPLAAGIHNFIVTYGTSGCTIAVTTVTTLATFTLAGAPAACTAAIVAGTYSAGTALTAANTATISVNVTALGAYNISTTVANGMIFSGSGVFTTTGVQTVVLTGTGTPVSAGNTDIPVTAGSSACSFPITVTGGATPATFTVNCAAAVINGTYTVNTPLVAASNTIGITVDVTVAGTYAITGTINGMTFSASGTFAATGTGQAVTLAGTGTPTTQGANIVPVTGGTAPCNVTVTVGPAAGPATFTVNCASAVVNGTYAVGTTLIPASNTVVLNVTVATAGSYTITATLNGMTFASSGVLAAGNQTVTLAGTGTPTTQGANSIPVTAGTAPCNFTVTVAPPPANDYFPRTAGSNWSYEFDDVSTDSVYSEAIAPTHTALGNTYNIFMGTDGSGPLDTAGYYRKSGNDYYHYVNLAAYLGGALDNTQRVEFIFIKDNQNAGFSWTSPVFVNSTGGVPVSVRIKFTILQRDVPISVTTSTGTVSYPNTIVIQEQYEADFGTGWFSLDDQIGFYKDYYSRDKGWIIDEYFDENGNPDGKMEVRRLVIN